MSLDVYLTEVRPTEIFKANITHYLTGMAREAGLYRCLWRPEEIGVKTAAQLIPLLQEGLELLESDPLRFKIFTPSNGWGSYEGLVDFVRKYLEACKANPDANVSVWR